MANDKKFIVKNGLLTEEDVIIGSTTDTGQRLQITGSSKFTGTIDASQSTLATSTVTFTNTGGTGGAVIAKFVGDSDALQVLNVGTGDYKITNSGQDNGIIFYDNTDGLDIVYNGNVDLEFSSTGIDFKREPQYLGNVFWNAGNDGAGSGLDADLIDGLDSTQFLRSDEDDTMTGTLTVDGGVIVTGDLFVSGTRTFANTVQLLISDNIFTLNADFTSGTPTENSGMEIRRGDQANSSFIWDESNDYFKLVSAGTDLGRIITTADEGPGNGFDADSVDGLEGYQFLRSDVADTANGHITFDRDITVGNIVDGDARINFSVSGQNRVLYAEDGVIGFTNAGANWAARSDEFDNWIVSANTVSDLFVDSGDTSYYGDFSGTSYVNNINLGGNLIARGDTDTFLTFNAADTLTVQTGGAARFSFNNTFNESTVDLRAPRFVDSDDNTYYADPASSSVFNTLGIDTNLFHNGDTDTFIQFTNNRIGFETGGAERFAVDDDSADFTVGVYAPIYYDSDDNTFYVDPASDSRVYGILLNNRITSDGDTNTYLDFNAADTFRVVTGGSQRLVVTNSAVTGTVDFVAPRFVDSNNNSYFANPASESVFHALGLDDDLFHNGNTDNKISFGTDTQTFQISGATRLTVAETAVTATVDFVGPRFVDSGNNDYYVDPAGVSQMSMIDLDSYVRHRGDTNTYVGFPSDDTFVVATGGTVRWTANTTVISSSVDNYAPRYYTEDYLYHTGDNSYLGFSANDTAVIATGGTVRLTVTNTAVTSAQNVFAPRYYTDDYILHTGDTNTYIGYESNDNFGIWTDATKRVTVDTTGLGIYNDSPSAPLSVQVSGTLTANPFAAGHTFADFGDGGTVDMAIRGTSNRDIWFTNEGNRSFYFSDSGATVGLGVLFGGHVTVNTDAVLYSSHDNTPVIRTKTDNKLHVNGSVQLSSINDAFVVGRSTATFLTGDELGFGRGGGFYMNDTNTITVRGSKILAANNEIQATSFVDYDDNSYFADLNNTGLAVNVAGLINAGNGSFTAPAYSFGSETDSGMYANTTSGFVGISRDGNDELRVYSSYVDVVGDLHTNRLYDRNNNAYWLDPQGVTGGWRLKTPSGYIDFGPMNTSYAHIQTDRNQFYFNKKLVVDEGIVQSYDEDLWLRRTTSTSARIRILDGTTYSDQDFYIRGGTAVSDPSKLVIESTSQENTQPGEMYAQMQFKVGGTPGGLTASGIIGTDVNTIAMITAEDFRAGDTSNEDSGLGFYTSVTGGTLRYNGGISSTGAWYVGNHRGTGTRGYLYATGYVYGQRFVDADNVNYYADPAGDSQMNTIDIDDYIRHRGDTNTYIGFEANDTFRVWTNGTQRFNVDNNSADFAVNVYAPTYYDSNDPTYYANPAGTSLFQRLTLPQNTVGQAHAGVATQPDYYIGQLTGDNDGWKIYGESPGGTNTGALILQSEDDFDGNESIRLRFKRTYGAYNTRDNLVVTFNYVETPTEFRAAIYRDSDDNNFYVDPNLTSVMSRIDIDDYIRHRGDTNTYMGFANTDIWGVWTNGTNRLSIDNNSADFAVNVYAPAYFDSNDNDFVLNPAGNSVLKTVEFRNDAAPQNDFTPIVIKNGNSTGDISTPESWLQFEFADSNANQVPQGRIGFRVGQNAGLGGQDDANDLNKEGSGNFVVQTSVGTGGSGGGTIRDAFQVNYLGNTEALGESRATLFRDRDDTNYYANPAGTSLFNTVRANRYQIDGSTYFIDTASGDYGSIRVEGNKGSWAGYAINDDWVFMADGPNNAGIYNDTDNEWAILARRNAEVELYYNGGVQAETASGHFAITNAIRSPVYYAPGSGTTYLLDLDVGNTSYSLRVPGIIRRDNFQTTGNGGNNVFLDAQDYTHWIWRTATDWGIFWAGNDNPAYSHFGTSNPNELVFVGNGNVRASLDLDNGNFYVGGTFSAANFALNGGNEDISINKAYTRGVADETLFDGTSYWEKRVIKNMQGSENFATSSTGEYVKSSDVPGSSSYVIQTASYRTFYSDYIEVEPGEEIYGEMWVKLISGSTDASNGGRFYYGVERFDKDKRPIAGNTGTTYFVSGGGRPNSTSWTKYSGYTTMPTSHTPYGSSDGGGVRYVRIRILMNYSGGTSKTRQFSAPILKRVNTNSRLRVDNSLYVSGRIDTTEYVDAYRFRDRDNNNYYTEPASTSVMATIDANIFRARGDTTYFLDPNADHSMRVYGEISNSNYANGNMQPGTLNIGRTDLNYTFSSTGWSSTVNAGMMANFSESWEFVGHDSGDAVKSFIYYDGTDDISIGRNVGWGTARVNMPGSAYAPIFYDSDDDTYRGNFAGTSIMNYIDTANYVTVGGGSSAGSNNPYNSVASTRLLFGSRDSNAVGNYYIGTNMENYGGNYTKLDLRWHTGIRMGAQAVYGGTRIFNNEDLSTLLFSVGRRQTRSPFGGSNITEDTATVVESGNFYAANLIDRDNDNYYLNPASTSVLNGLSIGGYTVSQPYNLQWYNTNTYAYSTSYSPATQYYWIRVGRANTGGAKGILEYYAKDDVNYSGNVTGRIVFSSWNSSTISVDHHGMGPSNSATATVRIDNDRWLWMRMSGITWDSRVWWRWIRQDGISGHTGSFTKQLDGNQGGAPANSTNDIPHGYQFRGTQGSVAGGNPTATTQYFGNTNGYYADFYRHRDRDNTGYYTEPAATSVMSQINMYGSMNHYNGQRSYFYTASNNNLRGFIYATDTNDEHLIIGTSNGEDIKFCDGNENGDDWNMIIRGNGDVLTRRYSDAIRHRDRNDTNYYADPASTSVFNALTVGSVTASGNISAANFKVLTGQSYTVSDPTSNGNNATGRASKVSQGLAIYTGYNSGSDRPHTYDITAQFMTPGRGFEISADWVSATGTPLKVRSLRDCCQGWSPWVDIATSTRRFVNTVGIDADEFRDRNDTNYYGNFAGTSVMNTLDLRGEVYLDGWFRNDTSGRGLYNTSTAMHWYSDANNRWRLYSTQSTAQIMFTTNGNDIRGYIEANDSNDIGFKDNDGNWALRTRGAGTEVYGNIYADRFYDRNNNDYYADPGSISHFDQIKTDGLMSRSNGRHMPFVARGEYRSQSNNVTGQIQIKLPTTAAGGSSMIHFTVNVYEYNYGRMSTFRIGGYAYSSRRWTNTSAMQFTDDDDSRYTIGFHRGTDRHYVTIGSTSDTWVYPQITISDVHIGYSGARDAWMEGWEVTISDDTSDYSTWVNRTASFALMSNNYNVWPTYLDAYRFRDRDNTGYYIEPANISYMSEIYLNALLRHNGDTNSYLYFRTADDVQMVSGGRQMFRMDEGTDPDRLRFVTDQNWVNSDGNWNMDGDVFINGQVDAVTYVAAENFRDRADSNFRADPAGTSRMNTIQADDIQSSGDITAYVSYSDIRFKENVKIIENPIEKVQKLDGITYNYVNKEGEYTGVIAQQVEEVLPGVVYETTDMKTQTERKAVRYGNMVGLLIEATKEQQKIIDNQQKEIDNLKEMVKILMNKLDK
jgi:hypothetical protein